MRVPGNGLNGPSLQLGMREVAKKAVLVLIATLIQMMELLTEAQTIIIKVSYAGPAIIK